VIAKPFRSYLPAVNEMSAAAVWVIHRLNATASLSPSRF
jgi:hypothetical protein